MTSLAQSLRDSYRLRQVGLAVLLGVVILGGVFYFERNASQQGSISQITAPGAASGPALRVGEPAPDFAVTGPSGETLQLSQFKGKPIWINFWASWCAPCRAEFPEMDKVYQGHKDHGLVLLAISFAERPEEVAGYLERAKPSFTIGLDPQGTVAGQYRVLGLPTHVFIDEQGIVRDIRVGPMNDALMEQKLATILPR